jgi:hypothetical protein
MSPPRLRRRPAPRRSPGVRASTSQRIEVLPFDQLGLYSEPGLSVSIRYAVDFFRSHLGATTAEKVEREAQRS